MLAKKLFIVGCISLNIVIGQDRIRLHDPNLSQFNYISENRTIEVVKIIVEFNDQPLFVKQKGNQLNKISSNSYQTQFRQFENDLNQFQNILKKHVKGNFELQIEREFYKVFNGASLTVPKEMLNFFYSLDYVKEIHLNKKVKAYLHESIPLIHVDSLWEQYGLKGDSIIVGILDTGIDYLHPALGGGIGEGYKVIGGYDVINEDDDPMDDHGHGTHVAGIVSANSDSLQGVAPNSLLFGIKVLDNEGFGDESQIIAGIERALDPNNDGDYEDKIDIANMSLGEDYGNPDDALSTAVNNAVDLGVVFCIAAGNTAAYTSIGSPGTAEKAITVGSSDKFDELSLFSSKGPTSKTYAIKPDILAPGSDILSSVIGGEYQINSGTSMASPIVAGLCALLKQENKNWTPEMMKAALMTTSIDLSVDVMSQGAGRVDALNAIRTKTFIMPSSLSFGLDIDTTDIWIKKDTLNIINNSEIIKDYKISVDGLIPGITILPDVSNFNLGAKESRDIEIILTVDNQIVPYLDDQKPAYDGNIYITSESDSLHLPWAFIKKSLLIINTDTLSGWYELFNKNNNYLSSPMIPQHQLEFLVSPGEYTLFVENFNFQSDAKEIRYIIRENIVIEGYKEISIEREEAIHEIDFNGVAENGIEIASMPNSATEFRIKYIGENGSFGILNVFDNNRKFFVSDFNEFSIYSRQLQANDADKKIRIVNHQPKVGLDNSYQFKNSADEFVAQDFNIFVNPNQDTNKVMLGSAQIYSWGESYLFGGAYPYLTVVDKFSGRLYINGDGDYENHIRTFLITDYISDPESWAFPSDGSWFITGYFKAKNDSLFVMPSMHSSPVVKGNIYKQISGGVINFGSGAIYNRLRSYNTENKIEIYSDFFGQLNERRESDVYHSTYQIFDDNGSLIAADSLQNFTPLEVPTGKYKYVVDNNHFLIGNHKGSSRTISEFDLSEIYSFSPTVRSLQIINSSETVISNLKRGEKAKIIFAIRHDSRNNKVYLKESKNVEWNEVEVRDTTDQNKFAEYYVADLDEFTMNDSTGVDLKIISEDTKYNSKYTYILKPAFIVNYWDGIVNVEEKAETNLNIKPLTYSLNQNYPNPFNPNTMIKYSLPQQSNVTLKLYDVLGAEIATLVDKELKRGSYEVEFDASNLSSGIYFYRLTAGNYVSVKKMILLK